MTSVSAAPQSGSSGRNGPPAGRTSRRRVHAGTLGRNMGIGVALFFALAPLYWMVTTSLKPESEATRSDPTMVPESLSTENYERLISGDLPFGSFLFNSVATALAAAVIGMVLSALGGYALSRGNFRLREPISYLVLVAQMLPLVVLLGPLYLLLLRADLVNTLPGLVVGYISFAVPFGMWLMKGFFDAVPREVEEAARVDGYPRWQILFRVVLPLTVPGLLTTGTFVFIESWNNLIYPLTLVNTMDKQTLPSGLILSFTGQFKTDWGGMMAASFVTTIPLLIAFFAIQRSMVRGLTAGAVAGE